MESKIGCKAAVLLTVAALWSAKAFANPAPPQEKIDTSAEHAAASGQDLRTLAEVIRQLQTQVENMNAELQKLREEQRNARAETQQLRKELESATSPISAGAAHNGAGPYPTAPPVTENAAEGPQVAPGAGASASDRWEEELQLAKGAIR